MTYQQSQHKQKAQQKPKIPPMNKYSKQEWKAKVYFSGTDAAENKCGVCGPGVKKMKKCNACMVARYCSRAHQKLDWPQHKLMCEGLKKQVEAVTLTGSLVPSSGDSTICESCGKYTEYISEDIYLCLKCDGDNSTNSSDDVNQKL